MAAQLGTPELAAREKQTAADAEKAESRFCRRQKRTGQPRLRESYSFFLLQHRVAIKLERNLLERGGGFTAWLLRSDTVSAPPFIDVNEKNGCRRLGPTFFS